jgi:hypothetical protein
VPVDGTGPALREEFGRQWSAELEPFFLRLRDGWGEDDLDVAASQLSDLIRFNGKATATEFGRYVSGQFVTLNAGRYWEVRFRPDLMDPWIDDVATFRGRNIVSMLAAQVADFGLDGTFDALLTGGVAMYAASQVATFANFGAHEGARASKAGSKTWQTNSGNPRSSHVAMSGSTVPLSESFPNGMKWPGDPAGGADEVANCQCSMTFVGG